MSCSGARLSSDLAWRCGVQAEEAAKAAEAKAAEAEKLVDSLIAQYHSAWVPHWMGDGYERVRAAPHRAAGPGWNYRTERHPSKAHAPRELMLSWPLYTTASSDASLQLGIAVRIVNGAQIAYFPSRPV